MQRKGNKGTENLEILLRETEKQFHQELKELKRLVKIWRDSQSNIKQDGSEAAILLQYAKYLEEANNFDRLKGNFFIKPIKYQESMKNIKNEKEIFLGISFLDQKEWKVSFNKVFIEKIKLLPQECIKDIFLKIYIFAQGFISFSQNKPNCFSSLQRASKFSLRYFTTSIEIGSEIIFILTSIGVHRIPHYNFNAVDGAKLEWFQYLLTITYEDLISSGIYYNEKKVRKILDGLENLYGENPRMKHGKQEPIYDEEAMNDKRVYYHSKKRDNQSKGVRIFPTLYKKQLPQELLIEDFNFRMNKFIEYQVRMEFLSLTQSIRRKSSDISELQEEDQDEWNEENIMIEMLEQEATRHQKIEFKNHGNIIKSLEQIPNFKFDLTEQQRQVLCTNGNLIIVGRSGTGKTTCAMLRLYGIEFLVKLDSYHRQKREGKIKETQTKCMLILLDEIKPMKNIFLTFSGRLIDEIKKQYDDMLYQIKERHAEKCQICKETFQSSKVQDQEEDPLDRLKRLDEQQERKVISLNSIKMNDFPGFFTIENFIRIIDKTISRPFFSQKFQHNNQNQANTIIKHAFINSYEYKADSINLLDTTEATCVDYSFFFTQIWEHLPKELTKASKQFCLLTPSIVWSEIFSIIKGSLKSYQCPGGYISLKMYMEDHQSVFHLQQRMVEYKTRVYKIFKSYVNWCKNEKNAYDLMDAVNHILKEIEFYGYSGPKIHCMFIDQVQDLTSSTTFLISKMVLNNIFYCGDSAQAITKGVSFRFEDIKFIFNKEYCDNSIRLENPKEIIYLTVNFRSHNLILQLANSVLMSIQSLFPASINKIKKEKSDLFGPKPFILLNQPKEMLFYLICGPAAAIQAEDLNGEDNLREIIINSENRQRERFQRKKKKLKGKERKMTEDEQEMSDESDYEEQQEQPEKRKFNSEQIIIVRNNKQKKKLPKSLKNGIVLIPETAKGLEFDEVILYNFFSSCPIFDKWNSLLEHLQPEYIWQDEKQFQLELSRRSKEAKKEVVPLSDEVKKFLGYDKEKKAYKIWNVKAKDSLKGVTINLYHELASQLKILYTVITRARSVIVIFDEKMPNNLMKIWQKLNLVTFVNDDNIMDCFKVKNQYVAHKERHIKYVNPNQHWFNAGGQMLARRDYENAKKCYMNIGRKDLVQRIRALQLEIKAENQMFRIKNGLNNIQNLARDDRKIAKVKLDKSKEEAYNLYRQAGEIYQRYNRKADAAEAYYKCEEYQLALKYYTMIENDDKIAQCCKKLKRYKEAIYIFEKKNDVEGLIGCYIELKKWNELFSLLIENTQYITSFPSLSNIVLDCIKKVLHQTTQNERVKQMEEYYQNFYGLKFQENLQKKRLYDKKQIESLSIKLALQYQFYAFSAMQAKMKKQEHNYEAIKQKYYSFKAKLQINQQEEDKVLARQAECYKERDQHLEKIKIVEDRIKILETIFLQEELHQNSQYNQLLKRLDELTIMKGHIYDQRLEIMHQLETIHYQLLAIQPLEQQAFNQFEKSRSSYDQVQVKNGIALMTKKIRQIIIAFKVQAGKEKGKPENKAPKNANREGNNDFEMVSVSDISEMSDMWGVGQSYIGGLHLFPAQKEKLIEDINKKISICSQLLEEDSSRNYSPYHHKYIEERLMKFLIEKSTAESYGAIKNLKKCNIVESNLACLLMCDFYKDFICLSPKYIFGHLLQSSNNFKKTRYFREEMYVFQEKNENKKDQEDEDEGQLNNIEKFLATLDNNGLQHKVPRVGFEGRFYYETILSQLIFGMIVQGYYKQALLFLEPGPACRLAYLFSSYDKLIFYIKQIANKLNISNLGEKSFLFTEDERILAFYPQASVLNIFSIQNIFYTYDQCQSEPFLSKKQLPDSIDVEEELVKQYYQTDADIRIQYQRKIEADNRFTIRRYQMENNYLKDCLMAQKYEKQMLNKAYYKEQKALDMKISNLINDIREKKHELQEKETVYAQAQFHLNKNTIPQAVKKEYEEKLTALLFSMQEAQKVDARKYERLRIQRMDLDQQYKQLKENEGEAKENCERANVRISSIKSQINKIQAQINQHKSEKIQYEKSIEQWTPRQIEAYYNKLIDANTKQIRRLQRQILPQLKIKDESQLKDAVVKILMKQEQARQHEIKMQLLRQLNMYQIQRKSNIPSSSHFKFLNYYMHGQLGQNQQRKLPFASISETYLTILNDGLQLEDLLLKVNRPDMTNIVNIKLCNIIIFYLSYICNRSIREDIKDFIRIAADNYERNLPRRNDILVDLKRTKNQMEFCEWKLSEIPSNLKVKQNRDYNNLQYQYNNSRAQFLEYQKMLAECGQYSRDPRQMLSTFMALMFKKIKTLEASQLYFMQLLFGFFQCRIIRDCEVLDFIADEYILVRHNSIVIEKLLQQKGAIFAYYFDQQNKTVLCKFQDVQRIILGFIENKHKDLFQISADLAKEKVHHANKQKYLDKEIMGIKHRVVSPQDQELLNLTTSMNYLEKNNVENIFNKMFAGGSMMHEIKMSKREVIEYFLKHKHSKADTYYFASHQIRQYYFLEKMIKNVNSFCYDTLKDVKKKKEQLKVEFQNYMKNK